MILFALAAAAWHWLLQDIVPVYQIKGISKLVKLCLPKVQCFCDSLTSPPSERQVIIASPVQCKGNPENMTCWWALRTGVGDPCHRSPVERSNNGSLEKAPSNIRDREQFAKEKWSKIPAEHCKKLIEGYRKRFGRVDEMIHFDSQNIFGLDVIETPEGDKWPQLIVQQSLDREQRDTYVMKIKVEDGGNPPRSSTAILQVTVTDVNDNRPVFKDKDIEVNIPEDAAVGTSVTQLHATDADLGSNAKIHFYFGNQITNIARRHFAIDNNTGLITVKEPLDREESHYHKLTVLASDGSSTPSRATVTINITDINDNIPSIDTRYIINPVNGTVQISEKAPINTKIALITVTDKDADLNGKVTCFTDHDVPFRLKPVFDNQFLLETAAPLDYETTREYAIKIVASDSGKPPLNQSAMLLIKVKDENDNPPVFTLPVIGLSFIENNPPGTELTKISATDADSGRNAELSYMLGPNAPSIFNLDRRTGILTAVRKLDREKQDRYTFTVIARDNGMPSLQTNTTVTLSVLDQNDNSPSFTHNEYNFYVPENLPTYGTVGLITVTDEDLGENAEFTLSLLNARDNFIIDPHTGVIKPNITFDREQQGSYTFQVKAVDRGTPQKSSTVKVTIFVEDVNDNRPVFVIPSTNYSYELVPTSTNPGSVVTKVFAVDNDTGINADLRYSIVGGNSRGLFTIDERSGNISLKEKILAGDHGLHRLIIKVNDSGKPEPFHTLALVHLFVNETITNGSYVQELVRRNMETPVGQNIGDGEITPQTNDYVKIIIAIIAGTMTVILVIFVTALVRCRQTPRHKVVQKNKQSGEWVSPNQENRQIKKKRKKKKRSPKNLLLNFVTIEESKTEDPAHEHINGTLDIPVELEEQTMGKYNWGTTPTTFKPDSPDLAKHYKSASPQPTFQIKPETPVPPKKHHVIQELPLDNTFVVGCDSLSKCSSSSSDPYSVSECSCQGGFKAPGPIHTRQPIRGGLAGVFWIIVLLHNPTVGVVRGALAVRDIPQTPRLPGADPNPGLSAVSRTVGSIEEWMDSRVSGPDQWYLAAGREADPHKTTQ
ncbi:unnamed protein product [Ranitomeya imitator]|uniref:Cadherin domain-containing protein n=1 Tax=Ranitomeya imitator TaxID=111125 RepID=A0ABN9LIY8_9NEOB|nr:unnamed protein product [Ranitomeya imitator]